MQISQTESSLAGKDLEGVYGALNRVQAVIEFELDGTIIHANENFLSTLGYTLDEVVGKHHRMFCEASFANSAEYRHFWDRLGRGEFEQAEYKRLAKNGREVWISASYNPVFDNDGKPYKVIKFANDVTAERLRNAEYQSLVAAIGKAQAVIEFDMGGHVLTANDNFLAVMGYELSDIKGEHHRVFCEDDYAASVEYRKFWQKLNRGEFDSGRYKRVGNNGKVIWIQATYNPILDLNGKPYKVVKFASDITEQVQLEAAVAARAAAEREKVDRLLEQVARASRGDLTCDIAVQGDEPIDQLAAGVKKMITDLREVIAKVIAAAGKLSDSSRTIATVRTRWRAARRPWAPRWKK